QPGPPRDGKQLVGEFYAMPELAFQEHSSHAQVAAATDQSAGVYLEAVIVIARELFVCSLSIEHDLYPMAFCFFKNAPLRVHSGIIVGLVLMPRKLFGDSENPFGARVDEVRFGPGRG